MKAQSDITIKKNYRFERWETEKNVTPFALTIVKKTKQFFGTKETKANITKTSWKSPGAKIS